MSLPGSISTTDCGYHVVHPWPDLPPGRSWTEVTAVATNSKDEVFLFSRGPDPIMIFSPDGSFIDSWGRGLFVRPHGLTIAPDDSLFCTDDADHTVRKFSPAGKLLLTLGTSGRPSNTGATSVDFRTIQRSGPPFHFPTNVALSPHGEIYVADGYGNARIHKFTPDGRLLRSWGEPGTLPGQFRIPHGIATDPHGNIVVADRENSRLQFFSPDGEFLQEWMNIARPCQVAFDSAGYLCVAELGYKAGMWPGTSPPSPDATGGRLSIYSPDKKLLARWGGGENPTAPGDFFAPHDLTVDSRGNLYVAEVVFSAGASRGLVPPTCHTIQKFEFIRSP